MEYASMKLVFLVALLVFTAGGVTKIGAEEEGNDNGVVGIGAELKKVIPCARFKACSCTGKLCVCTLRKKAQVSTQSGGGVEGENGVVGAPAAAYQVKCGQLKTCSCIFRLCFCTVRG
ncbi:unnamed protein product [Linum tenue]|uniref:Uncharacterized protein n=1 Tax=Linum tenue TaxID=586396 RepID=A0AAV0IJ53_9ROSI|nr:unnamed protein product [Linum tenue]